MSIRTEPIRMADINARGLTFHITMEPVCSEEEFEILCGDLQHVIENGWSPVEAVEDHGEDAHFVMGYGDGSTNTVVYDARGSHLLIKSVTFTPPT
jgi:hypothetical protein